MKYYIRKSKNIFFLYKETTFQSIITDLFSILVWVSLIGMYMAFSYYIGRSWPLDICVAAVMLIFIFTSFNNKKTNVSQHYLRKELHEFLVEKNASNPSDENDMETAWDFIEAYYPDYAHSDEIAHNNDLDKLNRRQYEFNDCAYQLLDRDYNSDIDNPQIKIDLNQSHLKLCEDAILNYIELRKKLKTESDKFFNHSEA